MRTKHSYQTCFILSSRSLIFCGNNKACSLVVCKIHRLQEKKASPPSLCIICGRSNTLETQPHSHTIFISLLAIISHKNSCLYKFIVVHQNQIPPNIVFHYSKETIQRLVKSSLLPPCGSTLVLATILLIFLGTGFYNRSETIKLLAPLPGRFGAWFT